MLISTRNILFIFSIAFSFSACNKSEGEGGTSEIHGKVFMIRFDGSYTIPMDTVPAEEEDIYIIYGKDDSTYDDDFKTSYDGTFEFKYLLKGNYRIFVYTNDSTGATQGIVDNSRPKIPIITDISIKTGQSISIPDIYIMDNDL
jgi:hypothetical protein